jgi:hypothetical protein
MSRIFIVHFAAITGDIPVLNALGHYAANYDLPEKESGLTALAMVVIGLRVMGDAIQGGQRRNMDTLKWLLARGANPNLADKDGYTPFHHAVTRTRPIANATAPIDIAVCKLLLDYGADPSVLARCRPQDASVKAILEKYAISNAESIRKGTKKRPPLICPCGNDVPVNECHGAKNGVPLHPRMFCGCGGGKVYAKCCMKRRYFYRETLTAFIPPPRVISDPNVLKSMAKIHLDALEEGKRKGLSLAEINSTKIFPNVSSDMVQESYAKMADYVTDPRLDRCFRWALRHPTNDFMCARPWRKNGECLKRRDEWNSIVDDYVSRRAELGDNRSDEEIARLNKVNWQGSANWKHCGNPECSIEEVEPMSFQSCSRCAIVCYCSRDCQKAHWKQHKPECGEQHTEHLLPSQIVLIQAMEFQMKRMG